MVISFVSPDFKTQYFKNFRTLVNLANAIQITKTKNSFLIHIQMSKSYTLFSKKDNVICVVCPSIFFLTKQN